MSAREHDLRVSMRKVGPIYPVLVSSTGEILDGNERTAASDGTWPTRTLDWVKTEEDKLNVEIAANLARRHSSEYNRELVNRVAQHFVDAGFKVKGSLNVNRRENEVTKKVLQAFEGALSETTIHRLLDPKFKQDVRSHEPSARSREEQNLETKTRQSRPRTKGVERWAEGHDYKAWMERVGPWAALKNFLETPVLKRFGKGFWKLLEEEMREELRVEMCASCEFMKSARDLEAPVPLSR